MTLGGFGHIDILGQGRRIPYRLARPARYRVETALLQWLIEIGTAFSIITVQSSAGLHQLTSS
jgi:hypothetical protein